MTASTAQPGGTIRTATRLKLSLMMFLEFFVWGAWFVTMGTFLDTSLSASATQISLAYLTQSLGAIAAPFIIGLIADQFFSAQKVLGILHIAGRDVPVTARHVTDPEEARAMHAPVKRKYDAERPSSHGDEPLTPAERAVFELSPTS